jgi:hypothetical protein
LKANKAFIFKDQTIFMKKKKPNLYLFTGRSRDESSMWAILDYRTRLTVTIDCIRFLLCQ